MRHFSNYILNLIFTALHNSGKKVEIFQQATPSSLVIDIAVETI